MRLPDVPFGSEAGIASGGRVPAPPGLRETYPPVPVWSGGHPAAGDIRGLGLMVAVELVADRPTRAPFPRSARVTERAVAAARERGLLLYSSAGCVDGTDGDLVMLGPPLVVSDAEVDEMVELTGQAVEAATS